MLDTSTNRIHQLNVTAHFIWSHCEEVESAQELAALLADAFDVGQSRALRDVTQTIEQLQALGLVEDA